MEWTYGRKFREYNSEPASLAECLSPDQWLGLPVSITALAASEPDALDPSLATGALAQP